MTRTRRPPLRYCAHGCTIDAPTCVLVGDAREQLRSVPDDSVHCCVTSGPYYGLRDYGTARWEGGDPACQHKRPNSRPSHSGSNLHGRGEQERANSSATPYKDVCGKCGAVRVDKQIGLEQTPEEFVAEYVKLFREVRRVLRPDGTLWLNIGDSYATKPPGCKGVSKSSGLHGANSESGTYRERLENGCGTQADKSNLPGIKNKDLLGIPWMLAFALRADGWYLRQDVIWHKPNPMPSSVRDRFTGAHEYLFLLAKSNRYYFDAVAIQEPASGKSGGARFGKKNHKANSEKVCQREYDRPEYATRNKRSVWTITTRPYKGAHFATFPPALVEPCVKAGTSEKGVCPACGAPWKRVTAKRDTGRKQKAPDGWDTTKGEGGHGSVHKTGRSKGETGVPITETVTTGWAASCSCSAGEPVPATVLDPFAGSGTTLAVAACLDRFGLGVELNPDYVSLIHERVAKATGTAPGSLLAKAA